MDLTKDETLFVEFLKSFPQFYMQSHKIAENKQGNSILPKGGGKNEFKMYSLDDICHSCSIFKGDGVWFTPKTTDAIWYRKINNKFYIFLIEFKGDYLCKNSTKCRLVDVYDSLKVRDEYEFKREIKSLEKVISKFSDKMLNGLATKPLETVTIALPLIYEDYYEKNKNDVEFLDIRNFLRNSRIIYRVVSISGEDESNRQRSRGRSYRCSTMIPSMCKKLARERHDRELGASYEKSLLTYHKRYERAGIVYDAGFIDNTAFNNFINDYLK